VIRKVTKHPNAIDQVENDGDQQWAIVSPLANATIVAGQTTWHLQLSGFGFEMPKRARILGLTVRLTGTLSLLGIRLINISLMFGEVRSIIKESDLTSTLFDFTIGSADDVWDMAAEDMTFDSFGVTLQFGNELPLLPSTVAITDVPVDVTYEVSRRQVFSRINQ